MDFKKNLNSMYPGTWIWRKNKISCTRVHGFEDQTKFNVPGYMNLKKKIFLCVAQGVEVARRKNNILPTLVVDELRSSNIGGEHVRFIIKAIILVILQWRHKELRQQKVFGGTVVFLKNGFLKSWVLSVIEHLENYFFEISLWRGDGGFDMCWKNVYGILNCT